MNFRQQFLSRLKADTPAFFMTIRKVSLYFLGGTSSAYMALKTNVIDLPIKYEKPITDILSYLVVALIVLSGSTVLPTTNRAIISEQAKDEIKEDTIQKTKEVIADKIADKVVDISSEQIKQDIKDK